MCMSYCVILSGGTTNTAGALEMIQTMFTAANGDRPDAPNYALVVTDGRSNNKTLTYLRAMELKNAGVAVMVIGIAPAEISDRA